MAVCDIVPLVCQAVSKQCKNRRTVSEAMRNHRWISDIRGNLTELGIGQSCSCWLQSAPWKGIQTRQTSSVGPGLPPDGTRLVQRTGCCVRDPRDGSLLGGFGPAGRL
jgi:hypothetical protein